MVITSNAAEDVEKLAHSSIAGRNVNGTAAMENSMEVCKKIKNRATI